MARGYSVSKSASYQIQRERDNLGRFKKVVESTPYKILKEESSRILREMQLQVPYDSGDLYRSLRCEVTGQLTKPRLEASASSVHKGYDYAGIQHDTEWFNHPSGGKWHYVEDPFNSGVARIERRFEEEIKLDK